MSPGSLVAGDADRVLSAVACAFSIKVAALLVVKGVSSKNSALVAARQSAASILRTGALMSYPEIARAIGYHDHSSAMHSVERWWQREIAVTQGAGNDADRRYVERHNRALALLGGSNDGHEQNPGASQVYSDGAGRGQGGGGGRQPALCSVGPEDPSGDCDQASGARAIGPRSDDGRAARPEAGIVTQIERLRVAVAITLAQEARILLAYTLGRCTKGFVTSPGLTGPAGKLRTCGAWASVREVSPLGEASRCPDCLALENGEERSLRERGAMTGNLRSIGSGWVAIPAYAVTGQLRAALATWEALDADMGKVSK